jgi:UDP-2,4-diacetamido-2,4,6-trideoxy-beta-L-altropyranose hydrolase
VLDMRPATMADSDLLFGWANEARSWSKSTAEITQQQHDQWMMLNVLTGYPAHWVMIADTNLGSIGTVRFDMVKDVMTYRVSITIGSEFRGRGFGHEALDHACKLMAENKLLAEIKHDNVASRRMFERCGFKQVGRTGEFVAYRREPLL